MYVGWLFLLGGRSWPTAQCWSIHHRVSQAANWIKSCTGTSRAEPELAFTWFACKTV